MMAAKATVKVKLTTQRVWVLPSLSASEPEAAPEQAKKRTQTHTSQARLRLFLKSPATADIIDYTYMNIFT